MLGRPRIGADQSAVETALVRLGGHFSDLGYTPISPPHLYLGETLLSLYGEDLRARAFLFPDAERDNELCLRPDFTVPVALSHGDGGWDRPGAYTYQGPVFRRQQRGLGRPVEYQQAGIERFGDGDVAATDASVLAALVDGLTALGLTDIEITIGDLSIPFALLDALEMPDRRRDALRRHFWRPTRFHALSRRAVAPPAPSPQRLRLLDLAGSEQADSALRGAMTDAGEVLGKRAPSEIVARLETLASTQAEPPMSAGDADLIDLMLEIEGPAIQALSDLRALTSPAGVNLDAAFTRFENRLSAIEAHGIDPTRLHFDASFGRNLEYYDGFVFEVRAAERTTHPPLAGGGRYDAMTTELGASVPVPAVGGMIRPEAVLGART